MEDLEKQFITSCQSILLKEGKEICEEILVMIGEKDEMVLEKAKAFCVFFMAYKLDGVNTDKIKDKCRKYLHDAENYNRLKSTLVGVNLRRKEMEEMEEILDMGE